MIVKEVKMKKIISNIFLVVNFGNGETIEGRRHRLWQQTMSLSIT